MGGRNFRAPDFRECNTVVTRIDDNYYIPQTGVKREVLDEIVASVPPRLKESNEDWVVLGRVTITSDDWEVEWKPEDAATHEVDNESTTVEERV